MIFLLLAQIIKKIQFFKEAEFLILIIIFNFLEI
jgi:hypothetical protein